MCILCVCQTKGDVNIFITRPWIADIFLSKRCVVASKRFRACWVGLRGWDPDDVIVQLPILLKQYYPNLQHPNPSARFWNNMPCVKPTEARTYAEFKRLRLVMCTVPDWVESSVMKQVLLPKCRPPTAGKWCSPLDTVLCRSVPSLLMQGFSYWKIIYISIKLDLFQVMQPRTSLIFNGILHGVPVWSWNSGGSSTPRREIVLSEIVLATVKNECVVFLVCPMGRSIWFHAKN